jgi:hypothetical protein
MLTSNNLDARARRELYGELDFSNRVSWSANYINRHQLLPVFNYNRRPGQFRSSCNNGGNGNMSLGPNLSRHLAKLVLDPQMATFGKLDAKTFRRISLCKTHRCQEYKQTESRDYARNGSSKHFLV